MPISVFPPTFVAPLPPFLGQVIVSCGSLDGQIPGDGTSGLTLDGQCQCDCGASKDCCDPCQDCSCDGSGDDGNGLGDSGCCAPHRNPCIF